MKLRHVERSDLSSFAYLPVEGENFMLLFSRNTTIENFTRIRSVANFCESLIVPSVSRQAIAKFFLIKRITILVYIADWDKTE